MLLDKDVAVLIQRLKDQTTRDIVAEERCMDCCIDIMDETDDEVLVEACNRFGIQVTEDKSYWQCHLVDEIQKTITEEDIQAMEKQMQEEEDKEILEEHLPRIIDMFTDQLFETLRKYQPVINFAGYNIQVEGYDEEVESLFYKYNDDMVRVIVRAIEQNLTADSILLERKCNEE